MVHNGTTYWEVMMHIVWIDGLSPTETTRTHTRRVVTTSKTFYIITKKCHGRTATCRSVWCGTGRLRLHLTLVRARAPRVGATIGTRAVRKRGCAIDADACHGARRGRCGVPA